MSEILKSHKLDSVCYDVRGPVVHEASLMEARGEKILKLNIGNPAAFGFKAPQYLLDEVAENLRNADPYSDSKGLLSARLAIVDWSRKKGIEGVTSDDVYTGNGVSELIVTLMQGLLDAGDEVLIPSPDYPLWTAAATLAGGRPAHYVCDEKSNWYPDLADMAKKITPRTKGIVVIDPNNPTGALYPRDILEGIVNLAREHSLILFSDEIYDRLLFDGKAHTALAALAPDLFCVTLGGLSKSHRAAGFRAGWMCLSGDKESAASYIEGLNMLASMRLCSNVPAQYAVAAALRDGSADPDLLPGGRFWAQREAVMAALNNTSGLSAVRPEAAFYIFPRIDSSLYPIEDDERFALDLLKEKHILIVHGKGFNYMTPDHFRIVCLPEAAELTRAVMEIGAFLEHYKQ
ncbi:MAG: pyridoxal phosphate-dependent aminotransferase [Firmicutes bacterium]|nr:pyridoxal phosphate-dependent aminotransferase [Bacillota bacterium]